MGKNIWSVQNEPVPWSFDLIVCSCKEPGWANGAPKCSTCFKLFKHYMNRCTECGENYIDRYYFPYRCAALKECYKCCRNRTLGELEGCLGDCYACKHRDAFLKQYGKDNFRGGEYVPDDIKPRPVRDYTEVLAEDFSLDIDF